MRNVTTQFPAVIQLSALNGQNGFKIDGELMNGHPGYGGWTQMSAMGDINKDGYGDLLVGAQSFSYTGNSLGRSYVVFGGPTIGGDGVLPLTNLTGTTGFKFDGEAGNNYASCAYSGVGDINRDGYLDLLIGAFGHNTNAGRSYIVFGNVTLDGSGLLPLAYINGTNGFKLDGEGIYESSGAAVGAAGDFNGDQYQDFLIGSPLHNETGRTYLVFGGQSVGNTGFLPLSSLDGVSGFKLDGEMSGDQNGRSVSGNGDINGDGYADLLIGSPYYNNQTGRSYVVFGGQTVGDNGLILLSSLNGTNGFKLEGEALNDYSGWACAVADINGDGYDDLLIGAYGHNSNTGRSYVVFGGKTVGNSGLISLSSLNGTNGFKLDGEVSGDKSGIAIDRAGDINGDGYQDILIGAPFHNSWAGRSYVVFGGPAVGSNGLLALSTLDGVNGFSVDGAAGTQSGYPVSASGDVNSDGYDDFSIGAPHANGDIGQCYVVFGDGLSLSVNSLTINQNQTLILSNQNLDAVDASHPVDAISFLVSNIQAGQFTLVSDLGQAITQFNQSQINAGQVQFIHDGSSFAPDYDIQVQGKTFAISAPQAAAVTFYQEPFILNNSLVVEQGQHILMTSTLLNVTDDYSSSQINFIVSNLQHGQFQLVPSNLTIMQFTEEQLFEDQVYFTHDGSSFSPSYQITVSDPYYTLPPSMAEVTFIFPYLIHNQLTLDNGETVILSTEFLQAAEPQFNNSNLVFLIGSVQNGYFSWAGSNKTIVEFAQAQVQNGAVQFVHSGNQRAPGYTVTVSDGVQYSTPSPAVIDFAGAPIITQNTVTLRPDQTITLTPSNINITVTDGSLPSQVSCQIQDLQHARFTQFPSGVSITDFTWAELQAESIQVTQTSDSAAPSYVLSCTGESGMRSAPSTVTASFSSKAVFAPQLINNYLCIGQGGSAKMTQQYIYATQNNQPVDENAVFHVLNIEHGKFSLLSSPVIITFFNQSVLQQDMVIFTHDNSEIEPSYLLSVEASGLYSADLPVGVTFLTVNQPPILVHDLVDQIATVGEPFSYKIASDSFADPEGESLTLSASRFNSSGALPSWLYFDVTNNRFTGTPVMLDFLDINVTARDLEGLAVSTDFTLKVLEAEAPAYSDTIRNAIIGAVASGVVGLLFFGFKMCLWRRAEKYFEQAALQVEEGTTAKKQADFHKNVIRPLTKKILERIKLTGLLGYISKETTQEAISAIVALVRELEKQDVNLDLSKMSAVGQTHLLDTIARQTRRALVPEAGCCSTVTFSRFFCPETTPRQLEEKALVIAQAVKEALSRDYSLAPAVVSEPSQSRESMELKSSVTVADSEQPLESKMEEDLLSPSQQQMPSDAEERPRVSSNPAATFAVGQGKQALAMSLTGVGMGAAVGALDLRL